MRARCNAYRDFPDPLGNVTFYKKKEPSLRRVLFCFLTISGSMKENNARGVVGFSCCGARYFPCRWTAASTIDPFGVPAIFLADKPASSAIDPGTRLCSALSATGSAEQRGRCHSLRSLTPPPAALPSLPRSVSLLPTILKPPFRRTAAFFCAVFICPVGDDVHIVPKHRDTRPRVSAI